MKWAVEWFVEDPGSDNGAGTWAVGEARWYGRLANVVFVGPEKSEDLLEVGVDEHLRLVEVKGGASEDFEALVVEGIVAWRNPDTGEDEELDLEDQNTKIARKPATALRMTVDRLDRLAQDMGRCLEDARRMRCASDVEQAEAASRLRRHVVCGDLDALRDLEEDQRRDEHNELAARRGDKRDATMAFVARCEERFWRTAATGLVFRRQYREGQEVEVALCRGLEACRGRVTRVRDDDTYDVALEGAAPEVGVQIPPERAGGAALLRRGFDGAMSRAGP